MSTYSKELALLIFPTSTSIIEDVKQSTVSILKKNKIMVSRITMEKYFFSISTKKNIKALKILSSCLGIRKIEIAYFTTNKITSILNKIVKVGQKLMRNEKFYVKVFSENPNFIARDLEFIATGLLIEKLANKLCTPSQDQDSADRIIKNYIGKSQSYISFKAVEGVGGMTFGYLKKKVFIIIYDHYSLYCLKTITLNGFIPDILILFSDYNDLKKKLFLIHSVLNSITTCKIKLQLLQLNLVMKKKTHLKNNFLLEIEIINICSYLNKHTNIVLPFNLLVHPLWLIEYSLFSCLKEGKIPWFPYLFKDPLINSSLSYQFAKDSFVHTKRNFINLKKDRKKINKKSTVLKKNIRTYYVQIKSLNIRPNYIDNILNSI